MHTTDDCEMTPLFTEYLEETCHKIDPFNTMAWLGWLDDDSLSMLNGYIDNFEESTPEEEVNEEEVIDFYQLVEGLIELETGKKEFEPDYPDHAESAQYLCVMVTMELLRRKGLVTFNGSGKVTSEGATFELTELGKQTKTVI